jgi:hypothetical protein
LLQPTWRRCNWWLTRRDCYIPLDSLFFLARIATTHTDPAILFSTTGDWRNPHSRSGWWWRQVCYNPLDPSSSSSWWGLLQPTWPQERMYTGHHNL